MTVEARLAGLSNPPGAPLFGAGGSARLDLAAVGNRAVRGQLSLTADLRSAGAAQQAAGGVALYLFPELGYRPADGWNLSLSGVVSPLDASGVAAAGASWNILQGLTLGFHGAVMFGRPEATFAWRRTGGLTATLLARYVFGSA